VFSEGGAIRAMTAHSLEEYLQIVEARLVSEGYSKIASSSQSIAAFHRRKLEFVPIPMLVNTDWLFKWEESLQPNALRSFIEDSLGWVLEHSRAFHLVFEAGSGVVFPVLITAKLTSEDVALIKNYKPKVKQTAMKVRLSLPVVVALDSNTVAYSERTTFQGAARYRRFRRAAARICAP
jgi:hypothetical protein